MFSNLTGIHLKILYANHLTRCNIMLCISNIIWYSSWCARDATNTLKYFIVLHSVDHKWYGSTSNVCVSIKSACLYSEVPSSQAVSFFNRISAVFFQDADLLKVRITRLYQILQLKNHVDFSGTWKVDSFCASYGVKGLRQTTTSAEAKWSDFSKSSCWNSLLVLLRIQMNWSHWSRKSRIIQVS